MHSRYCLLTVLLALPGCAFDSASSDGDPGVTIAALNEDLRIVSDESSPERTLSHVSHVLNLSNGNVGLVDQLERTIRLYDSTGSFLRTVGRRGDGPGEFRSLSNAGPDADGFWVYDIVLQGRLTFFDAEGSLRRSSSTSIDIYRAWDFVSLLPDGRLLLRQDFHTVGTGSIGFIMSDPPYSGIVLRDSRADSSSYAVSDTAGKSIVHLFTRRHDIPQHVRADLDGEAKAFPQLFRPGIIALSSMNPPGALLVMDAPINGGQPGDIQLLRMTAGDSAVTETIALASIALSNSVADSLVHEVVHGFAVGYWEPDPIDAADVSTFEAAVRTQLHLPSHLPLVAAVLSGADGSLWIRDRFDRQLWRIVGRDGARTDTRIPAGFRPLSVTGTHVWGVQPTADDVPAVVRLRLQLAGQR